MALRDGMREGFNIGWTPRCTRPDCSPDAVQFPIQSLLFL